MSDLIQPEDVKITCETHPPGGQHVGVLSGVTIEHIPSGITVKVNIGRSQHRNRAVAMDALVGALTSASF